VGFFHQIKKEKFVESAIYSFLNPNVFLVKNMTKVVDFFFEQFSFPLKFNNKNYAFFNSKFVFFSRGKVWIKHVFHIGEGLEYIHFPDLRHMSETIRRNLNWRIDIMSHYANQISLLLIVQ
jgi:hypothetical protein